MASTSGSSKTVVVADDTAFVRDRFRAALENAGHKAIAVENTSDLLASLRRSASDVDLPEKNLDAVLRLTPTVWARLAMLPNSPSTWRITSARRHRTRSSTYGAPRYHTVVCRGRIVLPLIN